tara:strand:+ start:812 stop:1459 length:648 start_codon:yes stop_codon:yes gene_type:complete
MSSSVIHVRDAENHKNVILQVDGTNQLSVKDSTSQTSLDAINTKLSDKTQLTRLVGNTNHLGTGTDTLICADSGGRIFCTSDLGIPINFLMDNGGQQSCRGEDGRIRVRTDHLFGTPVSLKDNATINGAYQFNSSEGDIRKGQKITLSVRCTTGNTNWSCVIGFSMDGSNWKDTISDINIVPATHQIHSFEVIAPYWRFVFIANDNFQSWTIDYV